jgi:hypothetical protein
MYTGMAFDERSPVYDREAARNVSRHGAFKSLSDGPHHGPHFYSDEASCAPGEHKLRELGLGRSRSRSRSGPRHSERSRSGPRHSERSR